MEKSASTFQLCSMLEDMTDYADKGLAVYNTLSDFCFDSTKPNTYELVYRYEVNSQLFFIIGDYMYQIKCKLDELMGVIRKDSQKEATK